MPRQLTNLRIDEVSSVDRGAGEGVRITLMKRQEQQPYTSVEKGDLPDDVIAYLKREFSADQRRQAASSGHALPDGSFPINDKEDLGNAIRAIGRAKDPAKAKAHIKRRASALGATDMLPDSWSKRDANAFRALELSLTSILGSGDKVDKAVECFKQFHDFMLKADEPQESDMTTDEINKLIADSVAKAVAEAVKNFGGHMDNMDKTKKPAKPVNENTVDEGDEPDETGGGDSAADKKARAALEKAVGKDAAAEIIKALGVADPIQAEVAKRDAVIVDLQKHVKELTEKAAREDFAKRATLIGLQAGDGEKLRKAYNGDVESLRWMEETIAKLNVQVEKGGLLTEIGSAGGGATSAYDMLMAKARDIRKATVEAGKPITEAAAFVKAMELNPDLAKQEKEERERKINKLA